MSNRPSSEDMRGLQDDLQRLLDKRLTEQVRSDPIRSTRTPDPPARVVPAAANALVGFDFYGTSESGAARNPAGPRSSIGRKRSSAPTRTGRLHERIQELELVVLRSGLRSEAAEEALIEAERLYGEQVRALQDRVAALQTELDAVTNEGPGHPKPGPPKGRISKLLGR
ncbi:MAG: hypothetical protein ACYCX3_10990 [Thermoleophilia bacterium]